MAGEPKRRHSKAAKRTRRASIILESVALVVCKNCGSKTQPHIACMNCGFYNGKSVRAGKVQVTKA